MSARTFPFERFQGPTPQAVKTTLICRCGNSDDLVQPSGQFVPPASVVRHFSRRGWKVGQRPKNDRCPACNGLSYQASEDVVNDNREAELSKSNVEPLKPKATLKDLSQLTRELVRADAPEEPTREERRIIFAKLQDVYIDETKGYDVGWTDHKVATDLAVPRAWVAKIRDENFGPAKDNADIRTVLGNLETLKNEMNSALKACDESRLAAQAKIDELSKNQLWAKDVVRRIEDLEKLARTLKAQVY